MKNLLYLVVIIALFGCEKENENEVNPTILNIKNNMSFTFSSITVISLSDTLIIHNLYSLSDTSIVFEADSATIYVNSRFTILRNPFASL